MNRWHLSEAPFIVSANEGLRRKRSKFVAAITSKTSMRSFKLYRLSGFSSHQLIFSEPKMKQKPSKRVCPIETKTQILGLLMDSIKYSLT